MLIPLIMPLTLAVSCYETDIAVTDTKYTKTGAVDVQSIVATRTIKGAVDKSGAKKLQMIFGGHVADGSIAIYTKDDLYIGDSYVVGQLQMQSYFVHNGLTYRVVSLDPWQEQTGIKVYLGERHIAQELI